MLGLGLGLGSGLELGDHPAVNLAVHAESLRVWVGVGDAVSTGRLCLARHLVRVRVGVGVGVGLRVRVG